ncbi:hypothetical protein P7H06_15550 [Paenibacillus larvae]|nr:hypothetical protein [Paenibacillus larvae]MDT2260636.1 hypothetical protein [Paenibacillus larvae]
MHDIPVYGAEQTIHINKKGKITCLLGNLLLPTSKLFASRG